MQPTALTITLPQMLAFRLERQHLLAPATDAMIAAGSLIGAQAQVHSAGILQLRARSLTGADDAAMTRALMEDRTLVKLWAHRSTLHLMPAADLPMVLGVRRLRTAAYMNWYTKEGLSPDQVERLVQAIVEALALGPHSRMDLSRRLVPVLGEWARPWLEHSWGGVIKLACALGHLCHGPGPGSGPGLEMGLEAGETETGLREAKFVRLDNWLPAGTPITPLEGPTAVAALLRRYLAAFGPASPADFRKFSGLPAEPVRDAFACLAADLVPVEWGRGRGFILAEDAPALIAAAPPPGHISILPLFDPWLLAHQDTGQYLDDRHRSAIYRTAGWISPVMLRQGRVVAHWRHRRIGGAGVGKGAQKPGWEVVLTPLEKVYKKELPAIRQGLRRLSGGLPVILADI